MPEDWITTTEAAEISGYHPEHVRRLIRQGRIVGKKFGFVWQVSSASLLEYLQGNLDYLKAFIEERIPQIGVTDHQGTYLLWLDCRALGLDNESLSHFMRKKAKVGMNDGYTFGDSGSGFQRMNIACPRPLLEEALSRIEKAVKTL